MADGRYSAIYRSSISDPSAFWAEAARSVDWTRNWDSVLSSAPDGAAQWFEGGVTNTGWNALDRHVQQGRGNQLALIYDSPVTQTIRKYTYAQLTDLVAHVAGMLMNFGITKGDRVLIYMPAIPEAIATMLACARIGAIHSVVFGGFAAHELASRIKDAQPKLIVAASCGVEPTRIVPYQSAINAALSIAGDEAIPCIYVQRGALRAELRGGRDHDWNEALAKAGSVGCAPVSATDPLYIIYTSGTTGQPKGIVRPSGGHLVALAWSMRNIFDSEPGDVFWAASDIGWIVGHSYMVYGPLINGNTTVLYEGKPVGTPDAGAFWRVINDYRVNTMFTAPTAIRAIKREDPDARLLAKYDISSLRALYLAGERCDPPTSQWVEGILKRPIIDNWWQTETGWPIAANPIGVQRFPIKHGSVTKPVPGWDVQILDTEGRQVEAGQSGNVACKLPLPPGAATTLWNAPERYRQAYLTRYPGYYLTGDAGFFDQDGYLSIMTRIDDVINVAGHRLSTGAIEEVLAGHPDVAECAVVGLDDALKGQVPLGLIVLKAGVVRAPEAVISELVRDVREKMGAVVAFKRAIVLPRLPKTRSGKILRGTVAKIANGKEYTMPATIEDPTALTEIIAILEANGIASSGTRT